jgi:hypothetical protein
LISAVGGVSRPGHFTVMERVPGTHWIGGWPQSRPSLSQKVVLTSVKTSAENEVLLLFFYLYRHYVLLIPPFYFFNFVQTTKNSAGCLKHGRDK